MKLARGRPGVFLLFASLLQACGGGGGDNGGGGPDPGPLTQFSLSSSNVSVTATPGEIAPTDEVLMTVTNPPAGGLFVGMVNSSSGIEGLDFTSSSATQATLLFQLRMPSTLTNGTYEDTVEIHVCIDDQCETEVSGSPKTIRTSYLVSGDGLTTATISRTNIDVTADQRESTNRSETTTVTLSNVPPTGVILRTTESSNAIQSVGSIDLGTTRDVNVTFVPGSQLAAGSHIDTIGLRLCYDESCVRQVSGSPFAITTTMNVSLGLEPGLSSLQVESREALGHNIIDAEFSKAMNAIVMVGSLPTNAIYVYDLANGVESQQALNKVPTSVSVAPDGLTAAVGHDALISVVDLPTVGAIGAPPPILLDVSTPVNDVILDSAGNVHGIPRMEDSDHIHSVDIATNTEQISVWFHYGDHFRRSPSGDALYSATDMIPGELNRWDVSTGVANRLYTFPYIGEHDACGDLFFDESGGKIFTACGRSFRTSAVQADDMIYAGTIPLTVPSTYGEFSIRSLSHFPANDEIVLIESHRSACNPFISTHPCFTRLAYYEDDFLNPVAVYGIGPIAVGGLPYAQLGRFVFHDSGGKKYLIGELENAPSEDVHFWLNVVE